MALSTKTIKRRIKSIGNTKKITKAMEMISAVKMRRAVANVLASRSYANLAWEMLMEIAAKTAIHEHPLLNRRTVHKVGVILITSNRGLAGGFSSRLLQEAHAYLNNIKAENAIEAEVILTGKRGRKIFHRFGHTIVAEFDKIDLTTRIEEVLPMVQTVIKDFTDGKYDKIVVAYMDFVSAIQQAPRIKQILPLLPEDGTLGQVSTPELYEEALAEVEEISTEETEEMLVEDKRMYDAYRKVKKNTEEMESHFLFEPNTQAVLEMLLPRLIETQMYQAILESDASEHSARMMAMRSASDSASDLIKELQYTYNQARQAAITREIAEIVGGAAALE